MCTWLQQNSGPPVLANRQRQTHARRQPACPSLLSVLRIALLHTAQAEGLWPYDVVHAFGADWTHLDDSTCTRSPSRHSLSSSCAMSFVVRLISFLYLGIQRHLSMATNMLLLALSDTTCTYHTAHTSDMPAHMLTAKIAWCLAAIPRLNAPCCGHTCTVCHAYAYETDVICLLRCIPSCQDQACGGVLAHLPYSLFHRPCNWLNVVQERLRPGRTVKGILSTLSP